MPQNNTVNKAINSSELLLLGTRGHVVAIDQFRGGIVWSTELPGSALGTTFVTLISNDHSVFAHTKGRVHCIDLQTGQIRWSNALPGLGYDFASLAFANGDASSSASGASAAFTQATTTASITTAVIATT